MGRPQQPLVSNVLPVIPTHFLDLLVGFWRGPFGMSLGLIRPAENVPPMRLRLPFAERGALRLFVRGDSFFANLRGSIVALVEREPPPLPRPARHILRGAQTVHLHYGRRSATASLFLHCLSIALVIYLPRILPVTNPPSENSQSTEEKIYYRIPLQEEPRISASAETHIGHSEARTTQGTAAAALPGALAHLAVTLAPKATSPDNLRQIIFQSASPPDVTIKTEQRLPNVVILGLAQETLKAPLAPSYARPALVPHPVSAVTAPAVSNINPPDPLAPFLQPTDAQPRLAIPLEGGGGAPVLRPASVLAGPPANAPDLVVLGPDPANPASQLLLPEGNRGGDISIAPPGKPTETGNGGKELRADATKGSGSAENGGRSGSSGAIDLAVSGNTGAGGGLDPNLPVSLVYAIAQPVMAIRRNALVISAGPIGGGGLNVYGALNCGKIYSIFLPMPGRNWSLQFCDRSASGTHVVSEAPTAAIRLEKPLVPPDVDLHYRFDFRRLPVPATESYHPIILKGVIAADGTVQQLVVYRGVLPELDEAARIAFSRWRFKPAMRDGKPVAVDILVGIPPLTGEDHVNR